MLTSTLFPALLLCGLPVAFAKQYTLYASHYNGNISALKLEHDTSARASNSSKLSITAKYPACGVQPSWLNLHKESNMLYCSDENILPGTLSAFVMDAQGGLSQTAKVDTIGGGVHNAVYHAGESAFVAIAHYSNASISTYPLPLVNGSQAKQVVKFNFTGPGPVAERQAASHPHQILLDPSGRFVLVPDLGADKIHLFSIDKTSGSLNQCPDVTLPGGSGPRHAAFKVIKPKPGPASECPSGKKPMSTGVAASPSYDKRAPLIRRRSPHQQPAKRAPEVAVGVGLVHGQQCDVGKTHWDSKNHRCMPDGCDADSHWDNKKYQCVPNGCAADTHWDVEKQNCLPDGCEDFMHWDTQQGKCVPRCGGLNDEWDPKSKKCELKTMTCPGGGAWREATQDCAIGPPPTGGAAGIVGRSAEPAKCPPGQTYFVGLGCQGVPMDENSMNGINTFPGPHHRGKRSPSPHDEDAAPPAHAPFQNNTMTSGYHLYVATEISNEVRTFHYMPSGGSGCPTIHPLSKTLNYPATVAPKLNLSTVAVAEIRVKGDFVYASNRGDHNYTGGATDSIAAWSAQSNGSLAGPHLGHAFGNNPRSFEINRRGNLVAIGNQYNGSVTIVERKVVSGLLGGLGASGVVGTSGFQGAGGVSSVVWVEEEDEED